MKSNAWVVGCLFMLVLVGGLIRAWPIADRPLWFDESDTWRASYGMPYEQFVTWKNHFETAPLSFLTVRWSIDLFGSTEPWVIRLPALVFGVLAIPAAFLLGYVAHSVSAGLLVATLAAFDLNMVDQSQQGRMYSLMILLSLLAVVWVIPLLRRPDRGFHGMWQWVGLGVVLGLQLSTLQFGVAVWFGLAGGAVALCAARVFTDRGEGFDWIKAASGITLAFVVGLLVAQVGVFGLVSRVLFGGGGDGAAPTKLEILREVVVAAKDLIHLGPAGLLVYPIACVGLFHLSKRCATSTAVLLSVGACGVLILFPFRKMHHFMDPRYLSLIQPTLFVGLAVFALGWSDKRARAAATAAVLLFATVQAWQCVHIERWWQQPDKYLLPQQIIKVSQQRAVDEGVVFHPEAMDVLGRYYNLGPTTDIEDGLYEGGSLRPDAAVPEGYDAPATWLVIGMVNWDGRIPTAKRVLHLLADHYGVELNKDLVATHLRLNRVAVARFSAAGVEMSSLGVGDDEANADQAP